MSSLTVKYAPASWPRLRKSEQTLALTLFERSMNLKYSNVAFFFHFLTLLWPFSFVVFSHVMDKNLPLFTFKTKF